MSVEKAAKTLFLLLSATTQKPLGEDRFVSKIFHYLP